MRLTLGHSDPPGHTPPNLKVYLLNITPAQIQPSAFRRTAKTSFWPNDTMFCQKLQIDIALWIIVRSSWFFQNRDLRTGKHLSGCIPCHRDRYRGLVMRFTFLPIFGSFFSSRRGQDISGYCTHQANLLTS